MGSKNTTDVLFKRDTLENINNTVLKDGQVLWTIDQEGNDKIYTDFKQSDGTLKRIQIGGTITVDQEFSEDSAYPLGNKKITSELRDFIPAHATNLEILTDALLISADDSDVTLNKTQVVILGSTTNLPEDCQVGVREVGRTKTENTFVRILGKDNYNTPTEWFNSWNGTAWTGWGRVITRADSFIGYNSTVNSTQWTNRFLKPTGATSDTAFEVVAGGERKAFVNYDGSGWFQFLAIQKQVVIDKDRNITANNLSVNEITSNSVNTSGITIKDSFVSNAMILANELITANKGISFAGQSNISHSGANLLISSTGTIKFQSRSTSPITIYDSELLGESGTHSVISPDIDGSNANGVKLGTTNHTWISVNAQTYLTTSDKKEKSHIAYLKDDNQLEDFYMNLKPVEYKWKNNGYRTHLGFYAQDIAENANSTIGDLAMFQAVQIDKNENGNEIEKPYDKNVDDEDLKWALNYDELIAPTVAMVQKQQQEIEELKQQIENLKR